MKGQLVAERMMRFIIVLLLTGCSYIPATVSPTSIPTVTPTAALCPTCTPAVTLDLTQEFLRSCPGWTCSLEGVVYSGSVSPGNELEGVAVHLSQHSYCSPASEKPDTITGAEGEFSFPVYLHDTDTFWIEIEAEGYEPVRQSIGGFDCLYCSCPPIEIVMQPVE